MAIALVVSNSGSLTTADQALIDALEAEGLTVDVYSESESRPDNDGSGDPYEGYAVAESVSSGTAVSNGWADNSVASPYLLVEAGAWDDLMSSIGVGNDEPTTQMDITNNSHEITSGFSLTTITVYTSTGRLGGHDLDDDMLTSAELALRTAGNDRPSIIQIDQGDPDGNGDSAPARRLLIGFYDAQLLTTDGETLLSRAIRWTFDLDASVTVEANTGAATAAGLTPTVSAPSDQTVTANAGSVTASGFTATIATSDHQTVTANAGAVTASGLTPTIALSDHQAVTANAGAVTVAGFTPSVALSDNQTVAANAGSVTLAGFAPTVTTSDHQTVSALTGAATASAFTASVATSDHQTVAANVGAVTVTGLRAGVNGSMGAYLVEGSAQDASVNADSETSHSYTHTFTSITQDGGLYVLIAFASDEDPVITAGTTGVTEILYAGDLQGVHALYYYKPTQAELDAGSKSFSFTTDEGEATYALSVEIAHAANVNPVGSTNFTNNSSEVNDVSAISVSTSGGNALLLSFVSMDASNTDDFTITAANGFTEFVGGNPDANTADADEPPQMRAYSRRAATQGSYDSVAADPNGGVQEQIHVSIAEIVPEALVSALQGRATWSGLTPASVVASDNVSLTAPVGSASAAAFTPTVQTSGNALVEAQTGAATLAGPQAQVHLQASIEAPLGAASAAGLQPSVALSDNQAVTANTLTATFGALQAGVTVTTSDTILAPVGTVDALALRPTVAATAHRVAEAQVGAVTVAGLTPSDVLTPRLLAAQAGAATLSGLQPARVLTPRQVNASAGTVRLTGHRPITPFDTVVTAPAPGGATAEGLLAQVFLVVSHEESGGQWRVQARPHPRAVKVVPKSRRVR